jgi:hypothetical protein
VNIGSADTAGINGNVDVVLLELLERKLKELSVLFASWTRLFLRPCG